jgi:hypothetical protein
LIISNMDRERRAIERKREENRVRNDGMFEFVNSPPVHRVKTPEQLAKDKTRWATWKALETGELKRTPCEVCGTNKRIEAHHTDYTKHLEVRWLCIKHHRELHRGKRVKR